MTALPTKLPTEQRTRCDLMAAGCVEAGGETLRAGRQLPEESFQSRVGNFLWPACRVKQGNSYRVVTLSVQIH
jgi:hypothetical protein